MWNLRPNCITAGHSLDTSQHKTEGPPCHLPCPLPSHPSVPFLYWKIVAIALLSTGLEGVSQYPKMSCSTVIYEEIWVLWYKGLKESQSHFLNTCTVLKMDPILGYIQRMLQTQLSMACKFTLLQLCRYSVSININSKWTWEEGASIARGRENSVKEVP